MNDGPVGGLKFCPKLGCKLLVHPIRGCPLQCPEHVEGGATRSKRFNPRRTAAARGYDGAWRKFRAWYFAQPTNQLCVTCEAIGLTRAARELHHLVPLRRRDGARRSVAVGPKADRRNLMGLCSECHGAITRAFERGGRRLEAIELEQLPLWIRAAGLRSLAFAITAKHWNRTPKRTKQSSSPPA